VQVVEDAIVTFEVVMDGFWHFALRCNIEMCLVHTFQTQDRMVSKEIVSDTGHPV